MGLVRWLILIVVVLLIALGFYLPQINPFGYYTHPDAYTRFNGLIFVLRLILPASIAILALFGIIMSIVNGNFSKNFGSILLSFLVLLLVGGYLLVGTLGPRGILTPTDVQTDVFEFDDEQYRLVLHYSSSIDGGSLNYRLERCTGIGLSCDSLLSNRAYSGGYAGFSPTQDQILETSEVSLDTTGNCIQILKSNRVDSQWCPETETASYPEPTQSIAPTTEPANENLSLPENENLLQNPGFESEQDAGLQFWASDISVISQVSDGILNLQFLTEEGSGFYQDISNVNLPAEESMIAWVSVSNPEATEKEFNLDVAYLDINAYRCTFTVPGNAENLTYAIRFKPQQEWSQIRVGIRQTENFAIGAGLNFDNINLRYRPNLQVNGSRNCIDPTQNEESETSDS